MKVTIITEFVKFKVLETTTDEQLISKADALNDFQKKYDGFINAELVKEVEGNEWCFVYHYESLEKLKVIGEKLRNSREFGEFNQMIIPGSLGISFHHQVKKWKSVA